MGRTSASETRPSLLRPKVHVFSITWGLERRHRGPSTLIKTSLRHPWGLTESVGYRLKEGLSGSRPGFPVNYPLPVGGGSSYGQDSKRTLSCDRIASVGVGSSRQ